MANLNRVVGQVKVYVDADVLETDGSSTMDIGGPAREGVAGDYQAGSFKESEKESKCETTILYKAGMSLSAIREIDNATLVMVTDIGQTWIIRNAYVAETISFSSSDGKAKVVFQGPRAEEMR